MTGGIANMEGRVAGKDAMGAPRTPCDFQAEGWVGNQQLVGKANFQG